MVNCSRCDGKGYIRRYTHYCGGVCFKCKGSGKSNKSISNQHYLMLPDKTAYVQFDIHNETGSFILCEYKDVDSVSHPNLTKANASVESLRIKYKEFLSQGYVKSTKKDVDLLRSIYYNDLVVNL